MAICSAPLPLQAEGPVLVRISPAMLQVAVGESVDVAIEVVDVEGLYGFDVAMSFDPAVVEVVDADPSASGIQLSQGAFLDSGFVILNNGDNVAGSAHMAMTQMNPSVAKDGTGALMVVRLRGKQAGASSALAIVQAELARRDGTGLTTSAVGGEIGVLTASGQPAATTMATPVPATPSPSVTTASQAATVAPAPSATQTVVAGTSTPEDLPLPVPRATATTPPPTVTATTAAALTHTPTLAPSGEPRPTAPPPTITAPSAAPMASAVATASPTNVVAQTPAPMATATPGPAGLGREIRLGLGLIGFGLAGLGALALILRRVSSRREPRR